MHDGLHATVIIVTVNRVDTVRTEDVGQLPVGSILISDHSSQPATPDLFHAVHMVVLIVDGLTPWISQRSAIAQRIIAITHVFRGTGDGIRSIQGIVIPGGSACAVNH